MKNDNEVKKALVDKLQDDILELEHKRSRFLKRGARNKNYFLLVFLLAVPYAYVESLGWFDNSNAHYLFLSSLTIGILFSYIRIKPLSMVAQSRITEYNKDVKNIFTKGFRVINRNWTYKPLYKTHINHFTNSGLLGEDFKVKKESDGLIIQGNQINIRLSQTIVYTNIKKTFEGLFITVKLENSGALNLDEIKSSLNNASHQTPINLNQQDDYLYLCISSENMMNIGLKEKEPLNFENIISKILTIKSIAEALCQISDKNAVSNTMELSY